MTTDGKREDSPQWRSLVRVAWDQGAPIHSGMAERIADAMTDWLRVHDAEVAAAALRDAADSLEAGSIWWGDYRDSQGKSRYGASVREDDAQPKAVGLLDWLRGRAEAGRVPT